MENKSTEFADQYRKYLSYHVRHSSGQRQKRLKQTQGPAELAFLERVWWPMFHQFDRLYPEFEVRDYKDGFRYIDFAYLRSTFRVAIEIDGFGPHWKERNQDQFWDDLRRQNHLVIDNWLLLRFPYREVVQHPRECQQIISQLLGLWEGKAREFDELPVMQREIVRVALRSPRPITPADVCHYLGTGRVFSQRLLRSLVATEWLTPAGGKSRIRCYTLHPSRHHIRV